MTHKLRIAAIIMAAGVFLFSGWKLYQHHHETQTSNNVTQQLIEQAITIQPVIPENDSQETSIPQIITQSTTKTNDPQMSVNFETLQQINPNIIAWIYCPDTPINYPICQANDNNYYLRRLITGEWNTAGTLFLDYRTNNDFISWNSVVYGHNMKNNSMFGSLPNYSNQAYYDEHPVIYLFTPAKTYTVSLLASYVTPSNADIYNPYLSETDIADIIKNSITESDFTSNTEYQPGTPLLTLSTCSYDYSNARYVVIGMIQPMT